MNCIIKVQLKQFYKHKMISRYISKILQNEHVIHNIRNIKFSLIVVPVITIMSQKFANYIPAEETRKKKS